MNTPAGWASSILLLKTLRDPPRPGSPREWALRNLVLRQEEIEFAKTRAIAQLLLSKEQGKEAFDAYMSLALPFVDVAKRAVDDEMKKALAREVKRGGMRVRAFGDKQKKKANVNRVTAPDPNGNNKEMGRLYKKLGDRVGTGKRR